MKYLRKSDVKEAMHLEKDIVLMHYSDKEQKDIVKLCFRCLEKAIDELPHCTVCQVGKKKEI